MFEVYKKTIDVEVNGQKQTYELKPLSGRYLPKLYNVIRKLNRGTEKDEILEQLDEETVSSIHELVYQTLAASYPDMNKEGKKEELDMFVSQNLAQFIGPLVEVNMNQDDKS